MCTPILSATEGKLKQHAVPGGFHETSPVFLHERIGDHAVFAERTGGADLVETHEARVACDVSRDYCGELRAAQRSFEQKSAALAQSKGKQWM
jgi:hypothetical protein